MSEFRQITDDELSSEDIPGPDADWSEIGRFALTFDGYEHWGSFEKCGEIANACARKYEEDGVLPDSIAELRTCLFFEQRRWRHFGQIPDEAAMTYHRALVQAIREQVEHSDK